MQLCHRLCVLPRRDQIQRPADEAGRGLTRAPDLVTCPCRGPRLMHPRKVLRSCKPTAAAVNAFSEQLLSAPGKHRPAGRQADAVRRGSKDVTRARPVYVPAWRTLLTSHGLRFLGTSRTTPPGPRRWRNSPGGGRHHARTSADLVHAWRWHQRSPQPRTILRFITRLRVTARPCVGSAVPWSEDPGN